ncbi:hypothetical protein KFU94_09020 [Chloroflexi bacterium TSY]|nr:hypothetical protein [Chloroflexi bacterium TSY]
MTPKSLQSRLKIAKNAKFGSTESDERVSKGRLSRKAVSKPAFAGRPVWFRYAFGDSTGTGLTF